MPGWRWEWSEWKKIRIKSGKQRSSCLFICSALLTDPLPGAKSVVVLGFFLMRRAVPLWTADTVWFSYCTFNKDWRETAKSLYCQRKFNFWGNYQNNVCKLTTKNYYKNVIEIWFTVYLKHLGFLSSSADLGIMWSSSRTHSSEM